MPLSSNTAAASGRLVLWPVEFTLKSYEYVMRKPEFWSGFRVSIFRVPLGVGVNIFLIIFAAFPCRKRGRNFQGRFFPVVLHTHHAFSGGVVSTCMVVRYMKLLNAIWARILPGAMYVSAKTRQA